MNWGKGITIIAASALCLGIGACNMYVIDFENKLPDGSVLAPKVDTPPPPPPEPVEEAKVAFMDSTTAQLDGCRVITSMRLSHNGLFRRACEAAQYSRDNQRQPHHSTSPCRKY